MLLIITPPKVDYMPPIRILPSKSDIVLKKGIVAPGPPPHFNVL